MVVCFEEITEFLGTEKACSGALGVLQVSLVKTEKVGMESCEEDEDFARGQVLKEVIFGQRWLGEELLL